MSHLPKRSVPNKVTNRIRAEMRRLRRLQPPVALRDIAAEIEGSFGVDLSEVTVLYHTRDIEVGPRGRAPLPVDMDAARAMLAEGQTRVSIAKALRVSRPTLWKAFKRAGIPPGQRFGRPQRHKIAA